MIAVEVRVDCSRSTNAPTAGFIRDHGENSGMASEEPEESPTLMRTRAAVLLTTLVAALSVVTGIVNIGSTEVSGPLTPYIPEFVAQTAGFTGAMTGFLMLVSSYGLRNGYRAAWYSTIVLLPMTALQGLAQSSVFAFPLVGLSVVAIPVVLLNRRVFTRQVNLTITQLAALSAVLAAQVYGTVGAYALREEFAEMETILDAFYFTLVTASTVGYGDITPVSPIGRLFAMSVLLIGVASFGVALGTLLGPVIEARLAKALGNMSEKQLDLLDDHYIVVGYSDLTEPILEGLSDAQAIVVVDNDGHAKRLRDRGYEVITADPSDEEPLQQLHIERARGFIVATNDDAQDALSVLTARELNPGLRIVASATDRENVRKLRRAGADVVLSPSVLGGRLLVESALGSDDPERVVDELLGG